MDEEKQETSIISDTPSDEEEHGVSRSVPLIVVAFVVIAVGVFMYFSSDLDNLRGSLQDNDSRNISRLALTEDPTVEIGEECSVFPRVIVLESDDGFRIVNSDSEGHTIEFEEKVYVLNAGEEVSGITSDIGTAPAVLWYKCDRTENAGLFRLYSKN